MDRGQSIEVDVPNMGHYDTILRLFDSGTLEGTLSKGGQRMISVTAIQDEKQRMIQRSDMRKLEARAKKANLRRQQRRVLKMKRAKVELLST
jgi:hypothetical protein